MKATNRDDRRLDYLASRNQPSHSFALLPFPRFEKLTSQIDHAMADDGFSTFVQWSSGTTHCIEDIIVEGRLLWELNRCCYKEMLQEEKLVYHKRSASF